MSLVSPHGGVRLSMALCLVAGNHVLFESDAQPAQLITEVHEPIVGID